ncbi:zinc-dependent alcohol dehydrogenase family protein [Halostella sp. JP-L12]|uniref:zinc-dependent alcohol dehydrogenase family protein n=1 Tax=Halostella TaxID=1843185 RepID=UPI000EF7C012|nr:MULTISPECIES: zinc-dependent alcohol dehydrogenase family protein [Halostella]NHN47804.1 zinc-dependent alcohol dehydrogenase family protein [Halostella sp. JP-L12]
MRAAVLREHGEPLAIEDVERPEPAPDQVVVETEACGICRSDWHAWQGDWEWIGAQAQPGQILGHEPAGVVEAVGEDVETLREGDRVAVPFTLSDGSCPHCRAGRANVCETVVPLGFTEIAPGAFAEAFPVRAADYNAVKLPDGVDAVDMAGLGCRFATAFHGLAHRADLDAGDWVAVHGCGGVGLSAVHIADALGANVVAVDVKESKLDAAEDLGADETLDASDAENVGNEVKALAGGGADVAVDALGVAATCRNALDSLGTRGQHLQIGLTTSDEGGEVPLPTDAMVMQEIDFLGSFGMPPNRYGEIFRMVERGKLDPGAIVSETVSLDEVPEQIASMSDFDTVGIPVVTEF